jgi:uncharacterized protein YukJ
MALHGYGLLIGKIIGSRAQRHGSPHWLLMVQPGDPHHPVYRVAVNLQERERGQPAELQYQVVNFGGRTSHARRSFIEALKRLSPTPNFLVANSNPAVPRLDFAHGGIVDPDGFVDLPAASHPLRNKFEQLLAAMAKTEEKAGAFLAIFGSGYPTDPLKETAVPTGYTGIENIHMNQGSPNLINGDPYYRENAPNQDGGLVFLHPGGATGIFVKFKSQTTSTDEKGNPTVTGIPEIDQTSAAVRRAIMPPFPGGRAMAARRSDARTSARNATTRGAGRRAPPPRTATPTGAKPTPPATRNQEGYLFADVDPADASGQYIPDNDANTYKTPYVMARSSGHTRGPVPTPRGYPRLDSTTIIGNSPPGYVDSAAGKTITFNVIGDSGAPSQKSMSEFESKVSDLITRDAATAPPAFLFHVGDVVYFYGEENYYYSQFYEPFRAYPAPIFAIPGNHDGITYNDSMVSLDSFQKAFCATSPSRWEGSGGILRSTMTQPGVYFTLDAPLVSIIGLYSNCGESFGWLDDQQLTFLYQELVRLKNARKNGLPAVLLAVHHFPRWFPGQKPNDPYSTALDATCKKAGFWPDAVICGHAHLYQRVVRQDVGQDVPYVLTGAGGYAVTPGQEVGKSYMKQIASSDTRLGRVMFESGYVRATVTSPSRGDPTLRFEYHSVKQTTDEPDDVCTLNLRTNKLA